MRNPTRFLNDYHHIYRHKFDDGRIANALRIYCSLCGDNGTVRIPVHQNGASSTVQEAADKLFRAQGWELGRSRKFDVCPACLAKQSATREEARLGRLGKLAPASPFGKLVELFPEGVRPTLSPDRQQAVDRAEAVFTEKPRDPPPAPPQAAPETPPKSEPMTEPEKRRTRMGPADTVALHNFLLDRLIPITDDGKVPRLAGIVRYMDGWDDERVAREMANPRITVRSVIRLREEMFGTLEKVRTSKAALEERVTALEEEVRKLRTALAQELGLAIEITKEEATQ